MSDSEWSSFLSARCFDENSVTNTSNSSGCFDHSVAGIINSAPSKAASRRGSVSVSKSQRERRKKRASVHSRVATNHLPSRNSHTTPGSFLSNIPDRVLCSIFETPKDVSTKVGMCIINYNTGEMILSEFMDSQIYIRAIHKLQIHRPTEILLPHASLSVVVSKLAAIVRFNIPESVKISEASSKSYNLQEGLKCVSTHISKEQHTKVKIEELVSKSFALRAAAAALSYTENVVYKSFSRDLAKFATFRVKYEATENTMLIDSNTISGLELVENNLEKNGLSLWRFLDSTCTKMGRRLLRNSILQPLTDRASIELRLEAVSELQSDPDSLHALRSELKCFQDMDCLFAKLMSMNQPSMKSDQKINCSILLKSTIGIVKNVRRILNEMKPSSRLLIEAFDIFSCDSIEKIDSLIGSYINEDCVWASSALELENQRSYAVRKGANGLLEISRKVYSQVTEQIIQNIEKLSEDNEILLDYFYDVNHGFHIRIKRYSLPDMASLPDFFINRSVKKNYIECTTLDIIKLNARLKEVMSEILLVSEQMISQLLTEIVSNISTLFMISEAASMLDLVCCFAHNAIKHHYVIPQISERLVLQKSRHPILESLLEGFVSNGISSAKHSSAVQIITGCNMSGKSVYLKQVALICVMAQMGSAVPAEYACCRIFKRIHARVCADSLEMCSSNFGYEMKEIAQFLDEVDAESLVILDELGRGSSIGDGFCISLAVTEFLIKTKCTVFLSTHFTDIPEILKYKPQVSLSHMQSQTEGDNSIKMYYQLSKEITQVTNPGLRTVSNVFSPEIMRRAFSICDLLRAHKSRSLRVRDSNIEGRTQIVNQMKRIHNLTEVLQGLTDSGCALTCESLKALQEEFLKSFDH